MTEDGVADERKPRIQSAARAIAALLAISRSSNGLKAQELREILKIPRQVTYHLLHTLTSTGIIRRNEQERYVLGLVAATVADGFRRQLAPPEHLAPRVRSLAAMTGETAYAVGWIDGEIAVLTTSRGHLPIHAAEIPHGFNSDAHARASGKLLLALAEPARREQFIATHKLTARTPKTITSAKRLTAELELARTRGYATDEEEYSPGLCCVAVPVEALGGQFVLGVSVPSDRFHANFDSYLQALKSVARLDGGED